MLDYKKFTMNLKGKKVLITGSDGFIGSHLTEKACSRGM